MLSRQEEEQERRETVENDLRVLQQQTGTFHQHAQAQAAELSQGRFAATGAPHVVGSQAQPRYPAAGGHQADPVGIEPPLGFSVNELEPSTASPLVSSVEQLGGAADAPSVSLPDVERAAPPSSSAIGGGPLEESFPASGATATVGSSPTNDGDE
jgi:hypothetical protein